MSRKLNARQRRAVRMLAQGTSQVTIAYELKLRPETLSRWKKMPEFRLEYERFMDQLESEMHQRILVMAALAIERVNSSLKSYIDGPRMALNLVKMMGIDRLVAPNMLKPLPDTTENVRNS